jgi:hypothetical protein
VFNVEQIFVMHVCSMHAAHIHKFAHAQTNKQICLALMIITVQYGASKAPFGNNYLHLSLIVSILSKKIFLLIFAVNCRSIHLLRVHFKNCNLCLYFVSYNFYTNSKSTDVFSRQKSQTVSLEKSLAKNFFKY